MPVDELEPRLANEVGALLAEVRRGIRQYVWLRGAALVVAAAAVAFWVLVAIDWKFEPPRDARLVLLALAGVGVGYVIVRQLATRAAVPLPDRSLALLLERHHDFGDSLLTAVELSAREDVLSQASRDMLAQTCRTAEAQAARVDIHRLFNWRPLRESLASAAGPG